MTRLKRRCQRLCIIDKADNYAIRKIKLVVNSLRDEIGNDRQKNGLIQSEVGLNELKKIE